jgi:pimeloyl-ACP methyl ester carboxylesterase
MRALRVILVGAFVALALAAPAGAVGKPTVVLVHGAFADASGWNGEIDRLDALGYPVVAPPNPSRGVAADAAYLRSFLSTIKGPVVLVGHSYGGVVITNAATGNPNVKALVYVAAYSPDQGDTVAALEQLGSGGRIGPATLDLRPYPAADGSIQMEGTIKTSVFRSIFAADVPARAAREMALTQRPGALATLGEPSGAPGWKSIASWYLIPTEDHAIGTDVLRAMARRVHPRATVSVSGASHAVLVSRPDATTRVILAAARTVR